MSEDLAQLLGNLGAYNTELGALDATERAGIDRTRIEVRGNVVNIWSSILREARVHEGKLEALIKEACGNYPDQGERLSRALVAYRELHPGVTLPRPDRSGGQALPFQPGTLGKGGRSSDDKLWVKIGLGLICLIVLVLIFNWPHRGKDNVPDPRTPAGPDSYPKVDARHPQRPPNSGLCTLTIFNETGETIRLWRFIPELENGVPTSPLGKNEMPGEWRIILLLNRELPPLEAEGGWAYITIERVSETIERDSKNPAPTAYGSAHQDRDILSYDKGWTYFPYDSHLVVHISKSFFNASPEDKERGFLITNRKAMDQPDQPAGP